MKTIIIVFVYLNVLNFVYSDPAICPKVVTKQQWGARDASFIDYTLFPLEFVIIHHTVTDTCDSSSTCTDIVSSIQSFHLDTYDLGDIGYNFIIGGDGVVYEGRGWHTEGAHTLGYNKKSIGVALIGNFQKTLPTDLQIQATKNLLQCGLELGELTEDYKVYGARQVSPTESPGVKFFDKLKKWPHFAVPKKN